VFVEGGVYHVYSRFASGEPVFADPEQAKAFVDLFRTVKLRGVVPVIPRLNDAHAE